MSGEEFVGAPVHVTGATGETGHQGRQGAQGERGPSYPPKMSEEQEHRVDGMIARQDRTMSFVRNSGVVVVLVAVLGGFAISAVFGALADIKQGQADGEIRGYKNRTPTCVAILLSPAMKLPDVCTEPAVLPYVCQAASQTNPAWVPRIEAQLGAPCTWPKE